MLWFNGFPSTKPKQCIQESWVVRAPKGNADDDGFRGTCVLNVYFQLVCECDCERMWPSVACCGHVEHLPSHTLLIFVMSQCGVLDGSAVSVRAWCVRALCYTYIIIRTTVGYYVGHYWVKICEIYTHNYF